MHRKFQPRCMPRFLHPSRQQMAAFKSDYGLLHLPAEILDLILSYVPDVDLVNVLRVNVEFEDAFKRLICRKGRKLNFSRCYHLRQEDLIEVLELSRDYITSVNINHCHWLTPDCLEFIMKLPKLQELHMIDCDISSLLKNRLIPVGLSALSISWNPTWFKVLGHVNNVGADEYPSKLFGNVKQLMIFIGAEGGMTDIGVAALGHCLQLETLEVFESSTSPRSLNLNGEPRFQFPDGILPKLSKLQLEVNAIKCCRNCIPKWIKAIFRERKNLLNHVCLGIWSYGMLECNPDLTMLTLPCINAEESSVVCLDNIDSSLPQLPAIPKIWLDRRTPKCKVVSFEGLTLCYMSDTSKLVAELGPQLQQLNLRNCQVGISDLVMGLTTIAKQCTRLTKLDLTSCPFPFEPTTDDLNDQLLIAISEFKALKVLYVSVGLLSRSRNLPNDETEPGQQKSRIGTQMEISEESMRSSEMWRLTQSCMNIKEFRITTAILTNKRVVCESALACISNWKKLKELHLINIPTLGEGSFLPFITKNCPQLANLYLRNMCCEGTCNFMTSLIESLSHATNLKDLSIVQEMELSSLLSNGLKKCLSLERVYLQSLIIKQEECDGFIELLLELPKLALVWVEAKFTNAAVLTSITNILASVKRTRPSLTYFFNEITVPTIPYRNHKSFADHWPLAHVELARYKTASERRLLGY